MILPNIWSGRSLGASALALGLLLLGAQLDAQRQRKLLDPAARMPALQPAVIDDSLTIAGEEIAARKLRSRMTVEVGVNGTGPYRFVVDSGADTSVIGKRLADALTLPAGRPALLNTMTDSSQVERVLVGSLQIGSSAFRDLELPRLAEQDIGATGMIGLDALANQRLMLDFDRRKISVDDASSPAPRMDGEIVVVARLKRGQLILTQVRANKLALDAVIDTGSEISIGNKALRDQVVRRSRSQLQKVEIIGVTGKPAMLELAVIDELRIGSITLSNVPIAFADVPPFEVFGLNQRPALLLGTDLMENFRRISLDFRARKVRFQLRKCTETVLISTTRTTSRLSADKGNTAACS
jgi:predicted aspartyl protease